MEAKQLRIGNFVLNPEGVQLKLIGIHHNFEVDENKNAYIGEAEYFGENITDKFKVDSLVGIPLTAEWLERFGYKQENTLQDGTKVYAGKPYLYFKEGVASISISTTPIKHVHQLQNLYFVLTGEELTLKEEAK